MRELTPEKMEEIEEIEKNEIGNLLNNIERITKEQIESKNIQEKNTLHLPKIPENGINVVNEIQRVMKKLNNIIEEYYFGHFSEIMFKYYCDDMSLVDMDMYEIKLKLEGVLHTIATLGLDVAVALINTYGFDYFADHFINLDLMLISNRAKSVLSEVYNIHFKQSQEKCKKGIYPAYDIFFCVVSEIIKGFENGEYYAINSYNIYYIADLLSNILNSLCDLDFKYVIEVENAEEELIKEFEKLIPQELITDKNTSNSAKGIDI